MGDLPQEFADIFVKEKRWSDEDLSKYKTHKYKELPEKTAHRLVKIFNLCSCDPEFLPERPFSRPINIAEITVAIASQLKTTHLTHCLISDNDKYQPNIDTVVYPSYISDPRAIPELSNELIDDRFRAYLETDSVWKEYSSWLINQPIKVQVAFTAYIATVSLRVCCKNPTSIEGYMNRNLEKNLKRFYIQHAYFTEPIAIPSLKFLTKLKEQFQLQTTICSNFYANCLAAYYTEYTKPILPGEYADKTNIVSSALLASTACNGLYILKISTQFHRKFNDHKYLTSLNVLKLDADAETRESALRFLEFFGNYSPSWYDVTCHLAPGYKGILWPWSRILDATYFKSLSVEKNTTFFVKFIRDLDPGNTLKWQESVNYKNIPKDIDEKGIIWHKNRPIEEKVIISHENHQASILFDRICTVFDERFFTNS